MSGNGRPLVTWSQELRFRLRLSCPLAPGPCLGWESDQKQGPGWLPPPLCPHCLCQGAAHPRTKQTFSSMTTLHPQLYFQVISRPHCFFVCLFVFVFECFVLGFFGSAVRLVGS